MVDVQQQKLLKVEDLSERLGICRATIFELKARGTLRAGSEYIKIGSRTRFFWPAVLERLVELTPSECNGNGRTRASAEPPPAPAPERRQAERPRGPRRSAANLDY